MNRITTTIAAAFIAATTTQAEAQETSDVFELSQHGAWTVQLEVFPSDLVRCNLSALSTQEGRSEAPFYITVDAEENYVLYWMVRGASSHGRVTIDAVMRVGRTTWTMHEAAVRDLGGALVFMFGIPEGQHHEFVADFMRGNDIQIDYDDGGLAELWSLQGSADAFRAFEECQLRIQPTY